MTSALNPCSLSLPNLGLLPPTSVYLQNLKNYDTLMVEKLIKSGQKTNQSLKISENLVSRNFIKSQLGLKNLSISDIREIVGGLLFENSYSERVIKRAEICEAFILEFITAGSPTFSEDLDLDLHLGLNSDVFFELFVRSSFQITVQSKSSTGSTSVLSVEAILITYTSDTNLQPYYFSKILPNLIKSLIDVPIFLLDLLIKKYNFSKSQIGRFDKSEFSTKISDQFISADLKYYCPNLISDVLNLLLAPGLGNFLNSEECSFCLEGFIGDRQCQSQSQEEFLLTKHLQKKLLINFFNELDSQILKIFSENDLKSSNSLYLKNEIFKKLEILYDFEISAFDGLRIFKSFSYFKKSDANFLSEEVIKSLLSDHTRSISSTFADLPLLWQSADEEAFIKAIQSHFLQANGQIWSVDLIFEILSRLHTRQIFNRVNRADWLVPACTPWTQITTSQFKAIFIKLVNTRPGNFQNKMLALFIINSKLVMEILSTSAFIKHFDVIFELFSKGNFCKNLKPGTDKSPFTDNQFEKYLNYLKMVPDFSKKQEKLKQILGVNFPNFNYGSEIFKLLLEKFLGTNFENDEFLAEVVLAWGDETTERHFINKKVKCEILLGLLSRCSSIFSGTHLNSSDPNVCSSFIKAIELLSKSISSKSAKLLSNLVNFLLENSFDYRLLLLTGLYKNLNNCHFPASFHVYGLHNCQSQQSNKENSTLKISYSSKISSASIVTQSARECLPNCFDIYIFDRFNIFKYEDFSAIDFPLKLSRIAGLFSEILLPTKEILKISKILDALKFERLLDLIASQALEIEISARGETHENGGVTFRENKIEKSIYQSIGIDDLDGNRYIKSLNTSRPQETGKEFGNLLANLERLYRNMPIGEREKIDNLEKSQFWRDQVGIFL